MVISEKYKSTRSLGGGTNPETYVSMQILRYELGYSDGAAKVISRA